MAPADSELHYGQRTDNYSWDEIFAMFNDLINLGGLYAGIEQQVSGTL